MERFFLSTGVFGPRPLQEILSECGTLGVRGLELSSGGAGSNDLMGMLRKAVEEGLALLIHNYFPASKVPFVLNLASRDSKSLKQSLDHCRSAMTMCSMLGIPFYSVHSGFAFDARPEHLGRPLTGVQEFPLEQAEEIFVESLKSLCEFGAANKVRLLIENNVVTRSNLVDGRNRLLLGASGKDLSRIFEKVGKSNLGFLVDVGHLSVTARTLEFSVNDFFEEVSDHVEAFHLSVNDGEVDNNLPFDNNAWFLRHVRAFRDCACVLEAYRLDRTSILTCLAIMREEL